MENMNEISKTMLIHLGGANNIENYIHCATRLRVTVKDNSKVNLEELNKLEEIYDIVQQNHQIQLVFGPKVEAYYKAFSKLCTIEEASSGKKALDVVLNYISGSIAPALPVMVASGLLNAVLALLTMAGILHNESPTYLVLSNVANACFYFLPVLIAFAGARVLKTNEYIAAFLAVAMIHPAINNVEALSLFGINIMQISYSNNIIPTFFMIPCLAVLDRFLTKILPDSMKFILKPFLITIVMVPLTLFLLGPVGSVIGSYLALFCQKLSNYGAISIGIMSFLQPILVLTGMHTLLIPLIVNEMTRYGFSYIFTKALAANFAIAGAAMAVGIKAKDKEVKQIGVSTSVTALLSVTEPALYGCLIRYRRPFVTAIISSGLCGIVVGALKLHAYAPASISLLTLPVFLKDDVSNFVLACIMAVISFVLSFVLTWIFGMNKDINRKKE